MSIREFVASVRHNLNSISPDVYISGEYSDLNNSIKKYYIYCHKKKESGVIFYIGLGSTKNYKRAYSKIDRNKIWKSIVNKYDYDVEILCDNLTELEAVILEIKLINHLGKLINKSGDLCNIADGGKGSKGFKHSLKYKENMSKRLKGKTLTAEHKKLIGDGNKGKIRSQDFINFLKINSKNTVSLNFINSSKGRIHSELEKKKRSESLKKVIRTKEWYDKVGASNKGKKRTEEWKLQKSKDVKNNIKGLKLILNLEDGIFYYGISRAATAYSLNKKTLEYRLKHNIGTLKYA